MQVGRGGDGLVLQSYEVDLVFEFTRVKMLTKGLVYSLKVEGVPLSKLKTDKAKQNHKLSQVVSERITSNKSPKNFQVSNLPFLTVPPLSPTNLS